MGRVIGVDTQIVTTNKSSGALTALVFRVGTRGRLVLVGHRLAWQLVDAQCLQVDFGVMEGRHRRTGAPVLVPFVLPLNFQEVVEGMCWLKYVRKGPLLCRGPRSPPPSVTPSAPGAVGRAGPDGGGGGRPELPG